MKFQVDRDVLSDAVSFVVKLMPARSVHPALSGVLIESTPSGVVLSAFDYEVSSRTAIAADVSEQGRILVSARLLADIANRLPDAPVTVSQEDAHIKIVCGKASFTLLAMPLEEYPTLPEVSGLQGRVPADVFADAISQVGVAASRDDVTPVITGVLFEASGNKLNLVATDRYRVAVRSIDWEADAGEVDITALVPVRIVSEVSKTFANAGQVKVTFSGEGDRRLIAFSSDDKTVTSVLIKGEYPPIQRLFPEDPLDNFAVVSTADLIEAVRRVRLVVERDIPIKFSFGDGAVTLIGEGGHQAQAQESVDIVLTGPESIVSLKPDLLLDGLTSLHSEFARLSFTVNKQAAAAGTPKPGPVLITRQTSVNEQDVAGFKYLLQPNLLMR